MQQPGRVTLPVLACVAWVFAGLASAQPVASGALTFDVPADWIRREDTRATSFSPADDPLIVLSVFTGLGDDGAEDVLERFVESAEKGETPVSRGDVEEISDDPFDIYIQRSVSRAADGVTMSRLYVGADPGGADTVIVLSGPATAAPQFEPVMKAILASLSASTSGRAAPASELPGDGGLDGAYLAFAERNFINAMTGRWTSTRLVEGFVFDPLGEVYRGGPERAGVALFEACDSLPAWRCGRYRVEGDHISLRWNDGTTERRTVENLESSLLIGGVRYAVVETPDAAEVIGAYEFSDLFNAGDWLAQSADGSAEPVTIRFLEGGKFSLSGFTKFGNPQFGNTISASGRFRIAGREITLVYRSGAVEVLSLSAFDDNGQRGLMIGGRAFNVSAQ